MKASVLAAELPVAHRVALPRKVPPLLGVGGFLKNTVCLTRGAEAWISRDHGELDCIENIGLFESDVAALIDGAGAMPVAACHDLHPDFPSTAFARRFGVEAVAIQHHHAHTAAVMAEHGLETEVLGLSLDGFGLGPDRQSWGGELLRVGPEGYARLGHLALLAQPGGDKAARAPWRMAAAALHAIGRDRDEIAGFCRAHDPNGVIAQMLAQGFNCPQTSAAGRLFDAACGLLDVVPVATFEGEAPMALEALVGQPRVLEGGWRIDARSVLDLRPLLAALPGLDRQAGAELFHGTLAAALADWVQGAAHVTGLRQVALSGGCLLNQVLRRDLTARLTSAGLVPLLPITLPPGDQAISLGQVWAEAMRRR